MDRGIRVVIADDHPFTRYGLRVLLESEPGITVVAEACDGREAVSRVLEFQPDVVVMDVRMPNGDGLWATQEIQRARPGTKVLVHSEHEGDPHVMAAMRAGASGFLLKAGEDVTQLTRAVRDVAAGAWIFRLSDTARMRPGSTNCALPAATAPSLNSPPGKERYSTSSPSPDRPPALQPPASASATNESRTPSPTSKPNSAPPTAQNSSPSPAQPASDNPEQPLPPLRYASPVTAGISRPHPGCNGSRR